MTIGTTFPSLAAAYNVNIVYIFLNYNQVRIFKTHMTAVITSNMCPRWVSWVDK